MSRTRQYEIASGGTFEVYRGPSVRNRVIRKLEFREVITVYKDEDGWLCISKDGTEWVLEQDVRYFVPYHGEELFTEDGKRTDRGGDRRKK